MRVLLVQPPAAALAGPSPALAYLAGHLTSLNQPAEIVDANLALTLRVLSPEGVHDLARAAAGATDPLSQHFLAHAAEYADTIDVAVRCLQGRDAGAVALCGRAGYLPSIGVPVVATAGVRARYVAALAEELGELTAPQREAATRADPMRAAFGVSADRDRAHASAQGVVDLLLEVARRAADPVVGTSGAFAPPGAPLTDRDIAARLAAPATLIDAYIDAIGDAVAARRPELVLLQAPDGHARYSALRMARRVKRAHPACVVALGHGEWPAAGDVAPVSWLFEYVDAVTCGDDVAPLAGVVAWRARGGAVHALTRTFVRDGDAIVWADDPSAGASDLEAGGVAAYADFPLPAYLSSGWPAERAAGPFWQVIHGASVDDDQTITRVLAGAWTSVAATGHTGVTFVGLPAPALRRLALRLVASDAALAWWAQSALDAHDVGDAASFARAGCVGISGVLRCDATLDRARIARTCAGFSDAGVAVHVRMHDQGVSHQAAAEAVEFVRALCAAGAVQSATSSGTSAPVAKALWHFSAGAGLDRAVDAWFRDVGCDVAPVAPFVIPRAAR